MIFNGGGNRKVYISSADWMMRNMDNRIEVGAPVYDDALQQRIVDIMEIQFRDTMKAREIDKEQVNQYVRRGNRKKLRSQEEIYDYLKQLEEKK